MPDTKQENSIIDLKEFFDTPENPLKEGEFKDFWMSLTPEERVEFKRADLKS